MTVRETVDAKKERFGEKELAGLFADATRVVVAKGKKVVTLDPRKEAAELAGLALGPTGNLRAPAVRMGKTWVIGFNEEAYEDRFD